MVVHIVMFRFKNENKEHHIQEAAALLKRLPELVASLRTMEVGINFAQSERAFDLSIIATFDDVAGLDEYANHPEHQKVVAFIKEVTEESKVVDYVKANI